MLKLIRDARLNLLRLGLFLFLMVIAAEYIDARPGGGSGSRSRSSGGSSRSSSRSSSGGGFSRSSSSGGSSNGSLPPEVAIPFIIIMVVVFIIVAKSSNNKQPTISNRSDNEIDELQSLRNRAEKDLLRLQAKDPNFSKTLFLDYAQNVFHQYYSRLDQQNLSALRPFFTTPPVVNPDFNYSEIVINAMHIVGVGRSTMNQQEYDSIQILLETNFTQTDNQSGVKKRFLSEEEWTFVRKMQGLNGEQVLSLVPAKMQVLSCPSCGAGESFHGDLQCRACGTTIEPAEMQWAASKNKLVFEESYLTNALISYAEEVGTNDPTIFAKNLSQSKAAFARLHNLENIDSYSQQFTNEVVKPAFFAIYAAWTKRDLQPVRHLISDFLYQTQQFWIDEYKSQGLTNQLDDLHVSKIELVKIDIDKYYETLTVRIFAACKDYTTKDSTGKVVGGNKDRLRYFSEYWTFVRRVGMDRQPKDSLDLSSCPSCSAPLDKIGQAGTCGYCSNKISTGEFSWVLSRITQDEAYA